MSLENSVVMICGGGGSLGRAVAQYCLEQGARVAILDAQVENLPQHEHMWTQSVDLLDAKAVEQAVTAAYQQFGRVDALVNTVGGFAMGTPVHATGDAAFEHMLNLNVRTVLNAVRAVVPRLLEAGEGCVVNVGAVAAHAGLPDMGAYIASKSMLMRLTESMAEELKQQGVRVNGVLPGVIDTPANRAAMPDADAGLWVAPTDLAQVIGFLCSPAARAVHGALIPVRGLG